MGFIWTTQLQNGVTGTLAGSAIPVRVALMSRAPRLTQESASAQISSYKNVTTMASLLSRAGWQEVSVSGYTRQSVTATTTTIGVNNYFALNSDVTFTLADTHVEAMVILGFPVFTAYKQVAVSSGQAFDAFCTPLANGSLTAEAAAQALDPICRTEEELVLYATDSPFTDNGPTTFRHGDAVSAQTDSVSGVKWVFGWATDNGALSAVAAGPVSLKLGAPPFEGTRIQHVWLTPQRVNYIANPSFEYSAGFWQSNNGALSIVTESTGYPSGRVGYVSGPATVSTFPQYSPTDRLYLRSTKFFPKGNVFTFQVMAKGSGFVRVGLANYNRDYTESTADWGLNDDFFFQEWELSEDHYTLLQGTREFPDTGYEAGLLLEVRGVLTDVNNFSTYQQPHISIDQCIVEEGSLLDWPYFDGDTTYGATGDHQWYGLDSADKVGKSYSLWYNHKRDINGRLFSRRVDDNSLYTSYDAQRDSMLSEWVPAGVAVVPHWGALEVDDSFLPPVDNSATTLAVELWPEMSQFFGVFEIVSTTTTSITIKVVGEGKYPISRAFIKSGTNAVAATISARPWVGTRADQINAALETLYDTSVAQLVTVTWPPVPAFLSSSLYIERGSSRSPQSFVNIPLTSATSTGFGLVSTTAFAASVTVSTTGATATSSGASFNHVFSLVASATNAPATGVSYDAGVSSSTNISSIAASSSAFDGAALAVYPIDLTAQPIATATGTTYNSGVSANAGIIGAAATAVSFDAYTGMGMAPTTGIGSGVTNNVVPLINDAPNPVTGVSVTYVTNPTISTTWNAVANWTLPADPDLASVKVRWTINSVVGAWVTLAATATTYTQAASSGVTHTVEVQTFDTAGFGSTTVPSAAGGVSPLDSVTSLAMSQTGVDRLTATWVAPSGNNRASYTVTVSGGATGTTTELSSATSKVFTVTPGVSTTVTVTPVDNTSGSRSGRSAAVSNTASASPPAAPTVGTWSFSSITINWGAAPVVGAGDTYSLERATNGGAFVQVQNTSALTYTGAVAQDTSYEFRVRAKGTNYSSYSTSVRPHIGHAAFATTTAFSVTNAAFNSYLGHADGVTVPANLINALLWFDYRVGPATVGTGFTTTSGFAAGTRNAYYIQAGGRSASPTGAQGTSGAWSGFYGIDVAGVGGGLYGLEVVNTGWSGTVGGNFRAIGTVSVTGDVPSTSPEVANTYW